MDISDFESSWVWSISLSTWQLVAVSRVQEIKFQVINQDRHLFIGLSSETLSIIYFYLRICTFLPGSTAQSTLWKAQQIITLCSHESRLKALHFLISFCWFMLLTDLVIGEGMRLTHGLGAMKNWGSQGFSLHWVKVLTTNLGIFALLDVLKVITLHHS